MGTSGSGEQSGAQNIVGRWTLFVSLRLHTRESASQWSTGQYKFNYRNIFIKCIGNASYAIGKTSTSFILLVPYINHWFIYNKRITTYKLIFIENIKLLSLITLLVF